ncbi:MAG: 3-dehydroquinate synthase [Clostridia bacterium]|nr:3-dehydroquinate synthase [Clostridia bacterium]
MIINMNLGKNSYDIVVERGSLGRAGELFDLNRKVLIITDDGVPEEYSKCIAKQCKEPFIECVPQGEESKGFGCYQRLLSFLLKKGFTRSDCVVAVGGGVVGDLSGFVAASFMRGIDFYNVPTTLLSQIDSSIGGKVAINLDGIKNIVGAFYQPKKVLVDPDVLKTLPLRQISSGLAEAIKMSLTSDKALFELFENQDINENIDEIIVRSLEIKRSVVEQDEREKSLRKILNFGHTLGHGIESSENLGGLYHGECVALGMIPMCGKETRERLVRVLRKVNLPTDIQVDVDSIISAMNHDKKFDGETVDVIFVNTPGEFEIKNITKDELARIAKERL